MAVGKKGSAKQRSVLQTHLQHVQPPVADDPKVLRRCHRYPALHKGTELDRVAVEGRLEARHRCCCFLLLLPLLLLLRAVLGKAVDVDARHTRAPRCAAAAGRVCAWMHASLSYTRLSLCVEAVPVQAAM